jgi:hypothetical protein
MKVSQVTDFSKKNLKMIIKDDVKAYNCLTEGDKLGLFNFFRFCAADEKADAMITNCPLLLAHRDVILKNTGLKIKTVKEVLG